MKFSTAAIIAAVAVVTTLGSSASAFTASLALPVSTPRRHTTYSAVVTLSATAMAEAGVPAASSEPDSDVTDIEIPTNLPSDCGMDYIPLATMLATGQLAEADQVRSLIRSKKKSVGNRHVLTHILFMLYNA